VITVGVESGLLHPLGDVFGHYITVHLQTEKFDVGLKFISLYGFVLSWPLSWPQRKKLVTSLVTWRGHKPVEMNCFSKFSFKKSIVL